MPRLPQPGGDSGNWGDILNEYLLTSLTSDGTLKPGSVQNGHIANNTVSPAKLSGVGQAQGLATLGSDARLLAAQVPAYLTEAALDDTFVGTTSTGDGQKTLSLMSSADPLADTSRLHIRSQQKQESQNQFNGGETVWLDVDSRAKSMLTWRLAIDPNNPRKPYPLALQATTLPPDSAYKRVVWAGAHWFAQDKPTNDTSETGSIHGHWSVEVPDVDMALRTRFQIFYNDRTDPTLIGTSAALISTSRADFVVEGGEGLV